MTLADRRGVETEFYEPAEDSRLLARSVVDDLSGSPLVVDVGTGSGYVGAVIRDETDAEVVGSDINPKACRRARERGLPVVRADLVQAFCGGSVDVVVFNPPYLPVDPSAEWDDWFEVALSGGESGREVIEAFLNDVGRVLAGDGWVYLLVSTFTGVDRVVEYAGACGFSVVALADVSYPEETLSVLKLVR